MLVARHMLRYRGIDRNSALVSSSVHNQRIERLWRDFHRCVTQLFYRLFYYLEYHGYLNPIDEKCIIMPYIMCLFLESTRLQLNL